MRKPILLTGRGTDSATAMAMLRKADVAYALVPNEDRAAPPTLLTGTRTFRGVERIRQFIAG